jgi:chromosomal replication initiator protein
MIVPSSDFPAVRGPLDTKDAWASVLEFVRARTKPQQFDTWFRSLRCLALDAGIATIATPNDFYRKWMENHYLPLLREACFEVLGAEPRIEFTVHAEAAPPPPAPEPAGTEAALEAAEKLDLAAASVAAPPVARTTGDIRLNPHYTFENFVVGPSNRLGHAASLAVTESPATIYNPLFLHGGVGLGKTHLLQAICHAILAKNPASEVCYLSCEAFVNQYIASLQKGDPESFRQRYRRVDMLLLDDVHFLASKKQLQEEFFHTFNTLYNSQKQIILSSDSPPQEIPDLEARLVSRFKWGLVAEVEPPLYETKVAIIRRKAKLRGKELPDGVVDYLANALDSNIRELEGAVLKVIVFSGLHNAPIDIPLCKTALKNLTDRPGQVNITDIMMAVATHFHLKVQDLQGKGRSKSIALPRQIAMHLARKLTPLSLEEIGGHFGGRDHTTVLYAEGKIREERDKNQDLRLLLEKLARELARA